MLDPGEHAAIVLALQQSQVLLLMDDASGRTVAARRGIPTIGTLGVLRAASLEGLVELPAVLARLGATNFPIAKDLLEQLIADHERRIKP